MSFLQELWALFNSYKFRGYMADGSEAFSIPLSWLLVFLFLVLLAG